MKRSIYSLLAGSLLLGGLASAEAQSLGVAAAPRAVAAPTESPWFQPAPSPLPPTSHADPYVLPAGYDPLAPPTVKVGGDYRTIYPEGCTFGDCCTYFWEHRSGAFGEFLYLEARGADVAYSQPRDGVNPANSVPVGNVGMADPGYDPGFRIGGTYALSRCSSIYAAYTWYQSSTGDEIATSAPFVLNSLVTHPNTISAAADSLEAEASYDIDFQLADVHYRRVLSGGEHHVVNYSIGARYGQLTQQFASRQPISPGTTFVMSEIDFNGGGLALGLDGERIAANSGLLIYGRGMASFLAGEFDARYQQSNNFSQLQAATGLSDDRIMPILELELGVGWQNQPGTVRVTTGYTMMAWYNALTTPEFITGVQEDHFVGMSDTLTFDGLTARIEFRR